MVEATIEDQSIRVRLIQSGKELFAERGYSGVSVREICANADASSTMIHHYFGSKKGLYDTIVDEFTSATFEVPLRLIAKPPKTHEEFKLRLEMFISETFRALVSQATVFRIIAREQSSYEGTSQFHKGLCDYLKSAQRSQFLDPNLNVELVTGLVLDRLGGQIMYASTVASGGPTVLTDEAYAEEWLTANTTVLLHGLAGQS